MTNNLHNPVLRIKRLFTFGDSWPAGSELSDADLCYRFPELVAKDCNLESRNLSEPATSIDHAVFKFLQILDELQDDSAVLFCLTAKERSLYFNHRERKELHPTRTDVASLSYYSHIYSEELGEHNRVKNTILIQELCEKFKIPLFFVCNWNRPPKHTLIRSHFYHRSLVEILDIPNAEDDENFFVTRERSPYIRPNLGHPNVKGHQLIAKELTNWIKEKL